MSNILTPVLFSPGDSVGKKGSSAGRDHSQRPSYRKEFLPGCVPVSSFWRIHQNQVLVERVVLSV